MRLITISAEDIADISAAAHHFSEPFRISIVFTGKLTGVRPNIGKMFAFLVNYPEVDNNTVAAHSAEEFFKVSLNTHIFDAVKFSKPGQETFLVFEEKVYNRFPASGEAGQLKRCLFKP